MGKNERAKGHAFERRIARWLRTMGLDAVRNLTETQKGNGGDVHALWKSPYPVAPPIDLIVEAKYRKVPSPWKAMDQVRSAVALSDDPGPVLGIAICHRIGDQTICCMDPPTLGYLLSGIWDWKL